MFLLQANYGGISVPLPRSLRGGDEDDEADDREEGAERQDDNGNHSDQEESAPMEGEGQGGGALDETWGDISFHSANSDEIPAGRDEDKREVEMNWHISKYLPEESSCRGCFQV